MKSLFSLSLALAAVLAASCSHLPPAARVTIGPATNLLAQLKARYAPDSHLAIYTAGLQERRHHLVLTGDVDQAEAKVETVRGLRQLGIDAQDELRVLPGPELGDRVWGISCLSVASGREAPEHKAEMGTQVLMGNPVRVWKQATTAWLKWYLVQSEDGYLAWLEEGTFVRCTKPQLDAWRSSPLLLVTNFEALILEQPQTGAEPVSDVVLGDLLKQTGESGDWFNVELPDGRAGYLPKKAAENFATWKQHRKASADSVEQAGRALLGRPYLWGGNSPKGLDCSGFTKLVFFLNGIDLRRNASHQAQQGVPVPLDPDLARLQKGDLLFFGTPARDGKPERIRHVGIYLGEKRFIHSSERVRISSLDPASPIRDENRIRTLLRARRLLTSEPQFQTEGLLHIGPSANNNHEP